MELKIKTNNHKFYRQFLELIRSIPPFNSLRTREIDVLAEIMYQYKKYENINNDVRTALVFSTEIRKEMRDNIDIIEESYNNNLSILKKKGLLKSDNSLTPFLKNIFYEDGVYLKFVFNG